MIEDSIPTMRKNRHFSMRIPIIFLLIIAIFRKTDAYEPPLVSHSLDRRTLLRLTVASSFAVSSAAVSPPAHASQYCTMGVGDDCENLAEGNELIKSLQARSAANREVYAQEARNAYYMKNYPDFFASLGKTLVKKSDGSFLLVDDATLEELKRDNQLTTEMPRAMRGQVTDLTQKPIFVLKE